MAGLWPVGKYRASCRAPAVWPCARPCALLRPSGERFHGSCVGRPAVLDPVGWGTPPPPSPRRRTGPGGGLRLPDCALRTACTERVHACSSITDLAEYRPCLPRSNTPPTMALEGALGVFGERTGGAFTSSPLGKFCAIAARRACVRFFAGISQGRTPGSTSGRTGPPGRILRGSMVTGSYGALVVHSLWRRRCGGWWDGAVPPLVRPGSVRRERRAATARRCTRWGPNSCGATPIRSGRSVTGAPTRCAWSRPTSRTAWRCSAPAEPPTRNCGWACSPRAAGHSGI